MPITRLPRTKGKRDHQPRVTIAMRDQEEPPRYLSTRIERFAIAQGNPAAAREELAAMLAKSRI